MVRLRRVGRFHFKGEHSFWNPTSSRELAWYYATSVDYLFANAIHPADIPVVNLRKKDEPVLDFSGGVGNNIISLALRNISCTYFGIGLIEYAFTEFRVKLLGLEKFVTFERPNQVYNNWDFSSLLKPRKQYGTVLAFDVLEHIPDYSKIVMALVASLRVNGTFFERTPFGSRMNSSDADLRVHVGNEGINMTVAMGPKMIRVHRYWKKVSK